ncbi:hypothetical protein HOE22_10895 [Candidatus Woesearchaeota archaeon]|jgi:hypothetical protein|nr:hypothetical protein [Candidatus Woesearchaeota archaeon]MBT4732578.1 hypothetical protein [Candidatus Woesearchaeota archaeon]MBT7558770.1 hypothetical protein [Candidatus Woesearchaeota archaeon]
MKDNVVYNDPDNTVMVRTNGEYIYIIYHKEDQMTNIVTRFTTDSCYLDGYEVCDDMKWILTFKVINDFEIKPELN